MTRSLIEICKQFTEDVTYIGQIIDDDFFRPRIPPENAPMRVLLCGESQIDIKGFVGDAHRTPTQLNWFPVIADH